MTGSQLIRLLALLILCQSSHEDDFEKLGVGKNGNLRVCVVEGKGLYKKAGRYCPVLESKNSGIECVIGLDRLDCMRRIAKGSVDFGVFSSEDLLAARWADIDILVTDELRFHSDPFEYEVVAIVDNRSKLGGIESLRGARFCHPGYGYDGDWTDTLANFFEAKVIPKHCDTTLSLMENQIRASAEFFSQACKAGPWVSDKTRDQTLKSLYPSLCASCYDQRICSSSDKYWGRRGPLHCISEESGDIAWARLDDTKLHFGLLGLAATADPSYYSYLCQDGTRQPVKTTSRPCVWIAKPWPVVAAKRKSAEAVSRIVNGINHDVSDSWQSALLNLIETYHVEVYPMTPQMPVQDYLEHAVGFQSANSFAECNPPRSITICTNTLIARHKCDWLAETARAHGLEPQLQCISDSGVASEKSYTSSEDFCFEALRSRKAEVTMAHPDWQIIAKRKYGLEPLVFENTFILNDLYTVVAVVKLNSTIKTFDDLKGKKACFPMHEGVAWNSVVNYFKINKYFKDIQCPYEDDMIEFFEEICAPGAHKNEHLTNLCGSHNEFEGEIGALKCLVNGVADVAFIGLRTLKNNTDAQGFSTLPHNFNSEDYRVVCPPTNQKNCFISWSTIGHLYSWSNSSEMRKQEIINTFKQLDQLFGKNFRTLTSAFSLYGPFDHKHNVIFQDRTKFLKSYPEIAETRLQYNYELMVKEYKFGECNVVSAGNYVQGKLSILIIFVMVYFLR